MFTFLLNGEFYTSFLFLIVKKVIIGMQMRKEKSPNYYFSLGEDGKYYIYCYICGKIAAIIDIHNSEYIGIIEKSVRPEFADILVKWLKSKEINELDFNTKNNKIIQFGIDIYCRDCRKVYCKKHWRIKAIFEDNGWYDYTEVICPEDHSKIIDV